VTLVILSATSKYRVKTMNSRIVDMRRSLPLSETLPKLWKKSNLDKFCKRYGWINQLPRQYLPAGLVWIYCYNLTKSATSRHFWEKVPSLLRIISRTRMTDLLSIFSYLICTTSKSLNKTPPWQTLFTPPVWTSREPPWFPFPAHPHFRGPLYAYKLNTKRFVGGLVKN
jgi:hypothetical protein